MERMIGQAILGSLLIVIPASFAHAAAAPSPNGSAPVTYTISADEALAGPKPASPSVEIEKPAGGIADASINVDAGKELCRINPMTYGACFEDLNHEIYGGLYAQMIFGESFEEGPEKKLPTGWIVNDGYLNQPVWRGMWCSENGAIGMVGFRWYKLLYENQKFADGTIKCEMMQPDYDVRSPIGLTFRAQGRAYEGGYSIRLDVSGQRLVLRRGEAEVKSEPFGMKFGQWVRIHVQAAGGVIRVAADGKPVLRYTDAAPLDGGLVGFEATESRGWFRNLKIETNGRTIVPDVTPVHPEGYRGPVSQWWDPLVTGGADANFAWDAERPFNSLRSQKIAIRAGAGTAGVFNRGLGRRGLSIARGRNYQGRLYLRGEGAGPGQNAGDVTVALQNVDGSRTYAMQKLSGIKSDWQKFSFTLISDGDDNAARFAIWIDTPGAIWVDQVVLMPTGDALFKGLPVRADIAGAVIKSGITCIRMGGDYSGIEGYRWKTMTGDSDRRPQYNSCWYPFESRGWGVIEFIEFCRAAGIEPIPCLNQDETPADVAELVRLYHLKYVQLDNGFAGPERTAAVADAMHAVDPDSKLLSGSIGHVAKVLPDEASLARLRTKLVGKVHAMALFPYDDDFSSADAWQEMLNHLKPLRGSINIYSQEVNGGLHNLQRALNDAAFDCVTARNGDFVDIVTYCGMVEADAMPDNGWEQGRIFFDNHHAWLQPHGWALAMSRRHYQPLCVDASASGPRMKFTHPGENGVESADAMIVGASRNEADDTLELKVISRAPFPIRAKIRIAGMASLAGQATLAVLTAPELQATNTADHPNAVVPGESEIHDASSEFQHTFPAYSYSIIELRRSAH